MSIPESSSVHTFSKRHFTEVVVPEGVGFAKYATKHEKQPGFGSSESSTAGGLIENLLEEDPFSSEASRILFNAIDDIRRCEVSVPLELPQVNKTHLPTRVCLTSRIARNYRTTVCRKIFSSQKLNRHPIPSWRWHMYALRDADHVQAISSRHI